MRQLKITKSITNRESQSLEKYLQEIGKVDLLTPEEEVSLAQAIKGRNPMIDGFGLIAFASLMPIIFVLIFGVVTSA